ncbi:Rox3-domain-containing protein [Metschnikowia bicuspidata]|uniref:Mediator of RNA polymerase II transcription subunit 19 n=1 Tax=Metschnikowia bicuspidata TaxID=27322 RepID=A0A4P9ZFP9_9ASCO|nr:Rox3-domain-containing protein [Metschnikowia bicuspidata]
MEETINVFAVAKPLADVYLIDVNDNLLSIYGLDEIVQSLARVKNDGTKGVKLRKSYKNHILDLPGKHQVPPAKPISEHILNPEYAKTPDVINAITMDVLAAALSFEKTPINGIPGFDTADLAISDQNSFMRTEDMSGDDERRKRKKKQQQQGGVLKRPHV